jgi:hypothetical protein
MSRRTSLGRLGALLAAAALLGACTGAGDGSSGPSGSGDGGEPGGPTSTAGGSAGGPAPYLPVPDGVVLTDQGSELGVGETAVVAWRPAKGEVAVLSLRVRQLRRAPIKELADWQLDAAGRQSSLFYVTVSAKNLGETDLGGTRIPLYVADDSSTLVESNAFKTEFKPCPSPSLPATFTTGDQTTACLVYLVPAHGQLTSVTFRPAAKFNPITWVGKVEQPAKPTKPSKGG